MEGCGDSAHEQTPREERAAQALSTIEQSIVSYYWGKALGKRDVRILANEVATEIDESNKEK